MQKNTQTPGTVLKGLLDKHAMNCNRLAKAINMSNAMVRLLILDKSPISVAAAFRLAKFFKTKPAYWLGLQTEYDVAQAEDDKELAKELNAIVEVSDYTFVRKPHEPKDGRKKEAAAAAKRRTDDKPASPAKRGRKPKAK